MKTRQKSNTLDISVDYASNESNLNWHSVQDWIVCYCERNKIPINFVEKMIDIWGKTAPYMQLQFKSYHQRNIFVMKGNQEFIYFEFM